MSISMSEKEESLFALFYELADLSAAELKHRFNPDVVGQVRQLVKINLIDCDVPVALTASEFVNWVGELRISLRQWSQYLGNVILESEDARAMGNTVGAVEILQSFLDICPWVQLKQVATDILNGMNA